MTSVIDGCCLIVRSSSLLMCLLGRFLIPMSAFFPLSSPLLLLSVNLLHLLHGKYGNRNIVMYVEIFYLQGNSFVRGISARCAVRMLPSCVPSARGRFACS